MADLNAVATARTASLRSPADCRDSVHSEPVLGASGPWSRLASPWMGSGSARRSPGGLPTVTVERAAGDWLAEGLPGGTAKTIEANQDSLRSLLALIRRIPLKDLTVQDVRTAPKTMAATHATRTLQKTHNCLTRALGNAEGQDLVRRNVSALVDTPRGLEWRPSQSLMLEQRRSRSNRRSGQPLGAPTPVPAWRRRCGSARGDGVHHLDQHPRPPVVAHLVTRPATGWTVAHLLARSRSWRLSMDGAGIRRLTDP